ncbi:hypothetical protein RH858_08580 [Halalkaliarchaeum sp. AArc-GB]|uniref:hypothetical protein n=1 Tax=Halalkaliarchaeum sp. AArc-GB TaxID=3074078 RepID=UPI002866E4DA|nr:hypothetical protein [Halalkaliarchaeum sp. AArc-GB]MDR5673203.1 hypothetical protein [Halalkaliarchaeum sp. AArc-GB]
MGSGAFSEVEANRTVTVATEDDRDAYLKLEPHDPSGSGLGRSDYRLFGDDEIFRFNIPGNYEDEEDPPQGEGPGVESVYWFDGLLEIHNQGTNKIQVYSKYSGGELANAALYAADDADRTALTESNPSEGFSPGQSRLFGLMIDTHSVSPDAEFNTTLTIGAKKPE